MANLFHILVCDFLKWKIRHCRKKTAENQFYWQTGKVHFMVNSLFVTDERLLNDETSHKKKHYITEVSLHLISIFVSFHWKKNMKNLITHNVCKNVCKRPSINSYLIQHHPPKRTFQKKNTSINASHSNTKNLIQTKTFNSFRLLFIPILLFSNSQGSTAMGPVLSHVLI